MMNNKIKVSKFYELNGLVEIRLKPECRYIDEEIPLVLYANSKETFDKLYNKLFFLTLKGLRMGVDITKEKCIENYGLYLNGIRYTFDNSFGLWRTMFMNTGNEVPYLYAVCKYYRGSYFY